MKLYSRNLSFEGGLGLIILVVYAAIFDSALGRMITFFLPKVITKNEKMAERIVFLIESTILIILTHWTVPFVVEFIDILMEIIGII